MSDKESEQIELDEEYKSSDSQNIHQRVLSLYNSNRTLEVAMGLWSKIVIEIAIVAVPLALIILLPGLFLARMNFGPITYANTIGLWITFSTTIFGITWCFLENAATDEEKDS
jgi:hypothetical protein